ncbi:type VI secretion system-associated lipoprotein [Xenophilus sp. AP218F]|nr:type VI secretion system lipoprotein TssJ [Chromobacterium sp. ASV5]OWY37114.1 type VI secretion system-associated lipoprotein [Xenophilus sp. AP218F]
MLKNSFFCKYYVLSILFAATLLTACAGPKTIEINSQASAQLNQAGTGKPLSVVVNIYQLKSPDLFNRLTVESINSGKPVAELLGDTVVASKEMILVPGAKQELEETIKEEARYVGVVGNFRQPDRHYWRLLYDADRVRSKDLKFMAAECYLKAVKPEALAIPGQPPATAKIDCKPGR